MKKLSKAQEKVINDMITKIVLARSYPTAEAYYDATNCANQNYNTAEKVKAADPNMWAWYALNWSRNVSGKCLVHAKTETIQKLEDLGRVAVLVPASVNYGDELVMLLNY